MLCTGFDTAEDTVLRKELMFLLAITEFSHSELLTLLPRKNGLASAADAATDASGQEAPREERRGGEVGKDGDGNRVDGAAAPGESGGGTQGEEGEQRTTATATARLDEALHGLAEFYNPQLEAANSTLKQGSFSLKSKRCTLRVL